MKTPPLPHNERRRLEVLRQYDLLDSLPEQALDDLTALAAHICGVPISLISLVDEHRQWFKSKIGLTIGETARDISFCGHAILEPDIFIIPDATKDERFADNPLVNDGIRFYAGAPLTTSGGEALGALCVMDRVPHQMTAAQQDALRIIGRQVMSQLELRKQTRELAESEARLHTVTENARVGLFMVDRDRRYLYANIAYAELVQRTIPQIVGHSLPNVLSDIYESSVRPYMDRAFSGERVTFEAVRKWPDGVRYYSAIYEPRKTDDMVTQIVGVITDITERKVAEAASEQQRAELQLILDAVPALVFYKDRDSRFIRVNSEAARQAGLPPESFIGKTDTEMGDPAGEQFRQDDLRVMNSGQPLRHKEEITYLSSKARWLLTDKIPYRDVNGRIVGVIGFSVDITARKQIEEALQRSQADLQLALQAARLGRWNWDIITGEVQWSPECLAIYGLPPDAPMDYARFLSILHPNDRPRVETALARAVDKRTAYDEEKRVIWPDGSVHWTASRGQVYCNAANEPIRLMGVTFDITERKQSEEAFQIRQKLSHHLLEFSRQLERVDTHAQILQAARMALQSVLGFNRIWFYQLTADQQHLKLIHVDAAAGTPAVPDHEQLLLIKGDQMLQEIASSNDIVVVTDARTDPRTDKDMVARLGNRTIVNVPVTLAGKKLGTIGTGTFGDEGVRRLSSVECEFLSALASHAAAVIDRVTAAQGRQQAELALRASEERLRTVTDTAQVGLVIVNEEHRYLYSNPSYARILRLPTHELVGQRVADVLPQVYPEQIRPRLQRAFAGERVSYELSMTAADRVEETRYYLVTYEPRKDQPDPVVVVVIVDITERKQAENRLRASEGRYRTLFDCAPDGIVMADPKSYYLDANASILRMLGYTREEFIGLHATNIVVPSEAVHIEPALSKIHSGVEYHREWLFRRKDSSTFAAEVIATKMPDGNLLGMIRDISERKAAETSLKESEERFRQLAENINEIFWITEPAKNQMLYISPAYERIWGRTCASLYAKPHTWLDAIHPDDRQRVLEAAMTKQVRGEYDETYRILRPDGSLRWIHDRAFPLRNAAGQVHRVVGTAEDISDRRQLEEQFRQAQKMEAIGQLAGGVAHDFNNILAAIMMQTELSALTDDLPGEVQEGLREISASAERAANLTRQLLLFSRKQVMHTRDLDLNEAVTSLFKMLQRIIGEHFSLQYNLYSTPLIVRADAGMLDQVLLNLVVNARDAMPKGGRITIETTVKQFSPEEAAVIPDASPGRYFCLCVTDTGCGISPENLTRIFEPFFTTKTPGQGTGLGLATVFGIAKQHEGFVLVESQIGQGTTFQILLPAATVASVPQEEKQAKVMPRGGTETILLVEDEPSVRMLTRILLERAGYKVLEASNGVEALQLWEQHQDTVQLLFTDIVMPGGLDGRELAARMQPRDPRLKVIFTSGYSAEMAGRELALKAGQTFIQKPATSHLVLQSVRHMLDI